MPAPLTTRRAHPHLGGHEGCLLGGEEDVAGGGLNRLHTGVRGSPKGHTCPSHKCDASSHSIPRRQMQQLTCPRLPHTPLRCWPSHLTNATQRRRPAYPALQVFLIAGGGVEGRPNLTAGRQAQQAGRQTGSNARQARKSRGKTKVSYQREAASGPGQCGPAAEENASSPRERLQEGWPAAKASISGTHTHTHRNLARSQSAAWLRCVPLAEAFSND
jgi:hypothetical protein